MVEKWDITAQAEVHGPVTDESIRLHISSLRGSARVPLSVPVRPRASTDTAGVRLVTSVSLSLSVSVCVCVLYLLAELFVE